jgi:hypothetical protein
MFQKKNSYQRALHSPYIPEETNLIERKYKEYDNRKGQIGIQGGLKSLWLYKENNKLRD